MKQRLLQMLTVREHTFMPAPLSGSSIVVDLGAHKGEFSREIVARFGCRCIAVEANPTLIPQVKAVAGVEVVWGAISGEDGELELHLSNNPEASTVLGDRCTVPSGERVKVPALRLERLLREKGVTRVDLLKVDIEGAEIAMFRSLGDVELGRIQQISLEFHDFCGLVKSPEVHEVCDRLEGLGFEGMRFGRSNMNWLFVQRTAVGRIPRLYLKHVVRRARRAIREGRRLMGGSFDPYILIMGSMGSGWMSWVG
jgi:FkbM family methyltransferase